MRAILLILLLSPGVMAADFAAFPSPQKFGAFEQPTYRWVEHDVQWTLYSGDTIAGGLRKADGVYMRFDATTRAWAEGVLPVEAPRGRGSWALQPSRSAFTAVGGTPKLPFRAVNFGRYNGHDCPECGTEVTQQASYSRTSHTHRCHVCGSTWWHPNPQPVQWRWRR